MKKNTNFLLLISGLLTATFCLSACINRDDAEFVETTPTVETERHQKIETKQPTSDINKMQFAEPNGRYFRLCALQNSFTESKKTVPIR